MGFSNKYPSSIWTNKHGSPIVISKYLYFSLNYLLDPFRWVIENFSPSRGLSLLGVHDHWLSVKLGRLLPRGSFNNVVISLVGCKEGSENLSSEKQFPVIEVKMSFIDPYQHIIVSNLLFIWSFRKGLILLCGKVKLWQGMNFPMKLWWT